MGRQIEKLFFLGRILIDLKVRGVQNILITYTDNLNVFTDTIRTIFPQLFTQTCVIHQIRNFCKYVVYKDKKEFRADIKNIYIPPTKRLLPRNLTILKRNGEESILMLYFHRETTGMTWLFSSSFHWKSEKLSIPQILLKTWMWKSESTQNQSFHFLRMMP